MWIFIFANSDKISFPIFESFSIFIHALVERNKRKGKKRGRSKQPTKHKTEQTVLVVGLCARRVQVKAEPQNLRKRRGENGKERKKNKSEIKRERKKKSFDGVEALNEERNHTT